MASRQKKIKLIEEAWKDLPTSVRNTIVNVYGGLDKLEDIELNKFYNLVVKDSNKTYKLMVKETTVAQAEKTELGLALDEAVAESLGLNVDDLTKQEEKVLTTKFEGEVANVEMKKKTVPTNELPENVLKYVNNYKVQYIDSRTEMTKSDWSKQGQIYSEKGMHPLQKFPEFQARDKDRMSVAANVSIANLEDDLKDDILLLEQVLRKQNEMEKYGSTKTSRKQIRDSIVDAAERVKTLQTGLADMYYNANMEILKEQVFTEVDGKYYLTDNNRQILIPEKTIQELAKRQDNVISQFSLLKNNIISATPKKTKEFKDAASIPSSELNVGDKLLADFDRRLKHTGFINDPNNATLDDIETAKRHWKMAGELAEGGKAFTTTEIASNTIIDMGDLGDIEILRDPKFEQGGRATEIGVVAEVGERIPLENEIEIRKNLSKHPILNFSGSRQVVEEPWGWAYVDMKGEVGYTASAKFSTTIGETIKALKDNPKGDEIIKFMGLERYTDEEWLAQETLKLQDQMARQGVEQWKIDKADPLKKRTFVRTPIGATEPFDKPIRQGPIVNSFMHSMMEDRSFALNREMFEYAEGNVWMKELDKLPKGSLQEIGTDYFRTYETLVASGLKLPVKEMVNPVGGKHSLIPSVSETVFNKYLMQIDFLNKKDFKGITDAAKIGPVIQELYKNIFEQPDIPLVTSKGYFANLGLRTSEVVKTFQKDIEQINVEMEEIKSGKAFGAEIHTPEKQAGEIRTAKMMVQTEKKWSTVEARNRFEFDWKVGKDFYEEFDAAKGETVRRYIESPTQKRFMETAKQKLPGLDIEKSITAPDNINVLIKEGYLFKGLPKSPGEFLERMNVIPPESKLPSDILQDKIAVQTKLEAYGRRIMFGQYKTYIKEAVKGKMTEDLFSMRPVSVTDIGPRDLPKGMVSTILESKEIQHGLPTGSLTGMKNVQQGMQTAASIEFLKDLQKSTKISTEDIAKQAVQGDFYEQLKDALKLLVKKG